MPGASEPAPSFQARQLIIVVGSKGGLEALTVLLGGLPAIFGVPIVTLLHSRKREQDFRPAVLNKSSRLPVGIAEHGAPVFAAGVRLVPNGYGAAASGDGRYLLSERSESGGTADALLASASQLVGSGTIAVILSGMLCDGSRGVRMVKANGGRVLVQDPDSALAAGMPSSAMATGCVDFVLPLERIAPALVALTMAPGGAELLRVPVSPWARLL